MTTPDSTTETIEAFSRLPWHDARLLACHVGRDTSDEPTVTLDILFESAGDHRGLTAVSFNAPRGVFADVDLLGKALCGDQIASGFCEKADESQHPFVNRLKERFDLYHGETLSELFLFTLNLIHPGGSVLIVARSFAADRPLR